MDAHRLKYAGGLAALALTAGCELFQPNTEKVATKPAPAPPPPPTTTAPAVAEQPIPPEDVAIVKYIANVNEAAARATPAADAHGPGSGQARTPAALPTEPSAVSMAPQPAAPEVGPPAVSVARPTTAPTPAPTISVSVAGAGDPAAALPTDPNCARTVAVTNPTDPPAATPTGRPTAAAPPVLTDVLVGGGGAAIEVTDVQTAPPAAAANAGATALPPTTLRELLDRYFKDSTDASFRAQLDARVMRVVAGDDADARAPLQLVTNEQQELASRFIGALIAIREVHLGNLTDGTGKALSQLEPLVERLSAASDLELPRLALCRKVTSFGNYVPFEPADFVVGSPVAFAMYCEVRNLVSAVRDDKLYHTELSLTTQVLARTGETLLTLDDPDIQDACRSRRRDFFVAREVRLPASTAAGEYVVKITVRDKLGQKVAESRATFRVIAK